MNREREEAPRFRTGLLPVASVFFASRSLPPRQDQPSLPFLIRRLRESLNTGFHAAISDTATGRVWFVLDTEWANPLYSCPQRANSHHLLYILARRRRVVIPYSRLMDENEAARVKTLEDYEEVMVCFINQGRGRSSTLKVQSNFFFSQPKRT